MKKTELDAYLESTKFREGQCWKILNFAWRDYKTVDQLVTIAEQHGFKKPDTGTIRPRVNELEMIDLIRSSETKGGLSQRGNPTVSYFITPTGWEVLNGNHELFRIGMYGVRRLIKERAAVFAAPMETFKEDYMKQVLEQMEWYRK